MSASEILVAVASGWMVKRCCSSWSFCSRRGTELIADKAGAEEQEQQNQPLSLLSRLDSRHPPPPPNGQTCPHRRPARRLR